jgi:transcriptional regulator with XRE-family HTH domain
MKTKPPSKPMKFSDQLRHLVANCGQTRYRIAKATGISEPALSRLVSGERFLRPEALDALGEYLGLNIVIATNPVSKTQKSR